MSGDRAAVGTRRSRSPGRFVVTAGVSLFLMADHIFRNRRGLPALIVKAPDATTPHRRFELPEPLAPLVPPAAGHPAAGGRSGAPRF